MAGLTSHRRKRQKIYPECIVGQENVRRRLSKLLKTSMKRNVDFIEPIDISGAEPAMSLEESALSLEETSLGLEEPDTDPSVKMESPSTPKFTLPNSLKRDVDFSTPTL
ncbi:hypothetical protein GOP47_0021389 [Adiantum capillus-veneris]|uniref:Uncharacterized protein n=1 Tax=Adiantum capillus-veneris TaxID=13818 RepID=A0A9D4Z6W9_ADICA|nr:hypothetical protein GOP47_0021389 [Adiantum capillus-veneris]